MSLVDKLGTAATGDDLPLLVVSDSGGGAEAADGWFLSDSQGFGEEGDRVKLRDNRDLTRLRELLPGFFPNVKFRAVICIRVSKTNLTTTLRGVDVVYSTSKNAKDEGVLIPWKLVLDHQKETISYQAISLPHSKQLGLRHNTVAVSRVDGEVNVIFRRRESEFYVVLDPNSGNFAGTVTSSQRRGDGPGPNELGSIEK